MRREFVFGDEEETAYLDMLSPDWETIQSGGLKWLLIHKFPIPEGYTVKQATAAIHIPSEYPYAKLDMVYFYPKIERVDGQAIRCTECQRVIDGKSYQRWSRHYSSKNDWIPGADSIVTHCMAIQEWLAREFRR